MTRTPVLLRFEPELLARIDGEAARIGKPRSETVMALIRRGLGDGAAEVAPPAPAPRLPARSKTTVAPIRPKTTTGTGRVVKQTLLHGRAPALSLPLPAGAKLTEPR